MIDDIRDYRQKRNPNQVTKERKASLKEKTNPSYIHIVKSSKDSQKKRKKKREREKEEKATHFIELEKKKKMDEK